ncbi:hypothetical protein T492DRAFT_549949 [Pavlovales sp. CCMP2436]|nr:hypothetical protein T492DRAFT_549949 [Pavlovales sp. CCMP2436]
MIMGPFFPLTYLLAAIGCILSYGLDKFNMLRQLPALPQNSGHLIVTTILGRVMPVCLALHLPIALLAYLSRSIQIHAGLPVGPDDLTCSLVLPHPLAVIGASCSSFFYCFIHMPSFSFFFSCFFFQYLILILHLFLIRILSLSFFPCLIFIFVLVFS